MLDSAIDDYLSEINIADKDHLYRAVIDAGRNTHYAKYLPINYYTTYDMDGDKNGWVYFIQSGDYVKIGWTTDIPARVRSLQTGSPHKLRLLVALEAPPKVEQVMHDLFASFRQEGEWFAIDGELLDYLDRQYRRQKGMR